MPTATPQQVQVIYQEAFGRDATQEELDYYGSRGIDLLETNLRNDPNAGGKYASEPDVGNAPEPENFGEPLSFDNWLKSDEATGSSEPWSEEMLDADFDPYYDKLQGELNNEKRKAGGDLQKAKNRLAQKKGWAVEDFDSVLNREKRGFRLAKADFNRGLKEGEHFKGLATQDKNRMLNRLGQDKDVQLGRLAEQKGVSLERMEQDLGISKERTERETGKQAAESGLYGSGQYQEELGEQLGDLQRGYERQTGDVERQYGYQTGDIKTQYGRQTGDIGREYERQYGDDPMSEYSRQVAGQKRDWQRDYGGPQSEYQQRLQDYNTDWSREYGAGGTYGQQRGDLQQGYERDWGTGEYTPYSMRKSGIGEDRRIAKDDAIYTRQNEAYQQYLSQYQSGGQYYQNPAYQ